MTLFTSFFQCLEAKSCRVSITFLVTEGNISWLWLFNVAIFPSSVFFLSLCVCVYLCVVTPINHLLLPLWNSLQFLLSVCFLLNLIVLFELNDPSRYSQESFANFYFKNTSMKLLSNCLILTGGWVGMMWKYYQFAWNLSGFIASLQWNNTHWVSELAHWELSTYIII